MVIPLVRMYVNLYYLDIVGKYLDSDLEHWHLALSFSKLKFVSNYF